MFGCAKHYLRDIKRKKISWIGCVDELSRYLLIKLLIILIIILGFINKFNN